MRLLIFLILLPLLQGCAGLAVMTFGTFESDMGEHIRIEDKRNSYKQFFIIYEGNNPSKQEVVNSWGKPNISETYGKCEVLTYYDGYTWGGAGLFLLVIPIPILLPSGHNENRLYFIDGEFVRMVSEYSEIKNAYGYLCGSNECEWIKGKADLERIEKINIDWCD